MTFKQPKPQKDPEPRGDVEVGDHLYVHHGGQPCTGVVCAHGRHGVTVKIDGQHHKVKWDKVLGHKRRASKRYSVVDHGEDGMLVEDDQGRRRFVAIPNDSKDDPMVAKSFGQRPVLLFMKAGAPPGPGLTQKKITDKNGVQTTRWVSTGAGGPPAQRGQHVGFQNGEHRGHGQVVAAGRHGVTVRDAAGGEHRVHHEKVTHHWNGEGAPDHSPHEENELEAAARETEAREGKAKQLASGAQHVQFKHSDGKRTALAGPDASKPGGFRLTQFDANGPVGHSEHPDLQSAVARGLEHGYEPHEEKPQGDALFHPDDIASLPDKVNQPAKSWDELVQKGTEGLGQFKDMMGKVQQSMGLKTGMKPEDITPEQWENDDGFLFIAPLKGEKRAKEKVEADYGGDWSQLRDIVRGTISVPSMDHVRQALGHLKSAGLQLAQKPKNRFEKPTPEGYRDLMTFVKLPNGMLAELQIHVKSMTLAKEKGHKDYEITRTLQGKYGEAEPSDKWSDEHHKEFYAAVKRQKDIYDAAWQKSTSGSGKQLIKSEQRTTLQLFFKGVSK